LNEAPTVGVRSRRVVAAGSVVTFVAELLQAGDEPAADGVAVARVDVERADVRVDGGAELRPGQPSASAAEPHRDDPADGGHPRR
jgi:hypothetical protein